MSPAELARKGSCPLGVTTSDRLDAALFESARSAAIELGVPFFPRTHKVPLRALLESAAEALVVFEAGAVTLADRMGSLRYSPGLAHLRIRQLDAGTEEDMLLRYSGLRPGDRVLDCTLGLAADAQVAARLVGPSGQVTGLEKSPALFLLVKHGLRTLARHPKACAIEVVHADAADHLRRQRSASFDVVLFDPMFERERKSSAAFQFLRRHADHSPLTMEMLGEARRVARRWVLVKGSRYSSDLKKLGLSPEPPRRCATVLWAKVPALVPAEPPA